jgi:hypothetical protein
MKQVGVWAIVIVAFLVSIAFANTQSTPIDPDALIKQILKVDSLQRANLKDVIFDAEYIDYEMKNENDSIEKNRYMKRVFVKYFDDTAWFHEDYVQWYKEGKLQTREECSKIANEKNGKKKQQGSMDISYPMLRPFSDKYRNRYTIAYHGIPPEKIESISCHKFTVTAIEPDSAFINGDYYFDSVSYHLVRVDFSPSKLVKKTMFKMKELNMSLTYAPTTEDIWLPKEFHIQMKARAIWVKNITVYGSEYYRNPVINTGIDNKVFEVSNDQ